MLQIITGSRGQIAYHDTRIKPGAAYPALNLPCRVFARGAALQAANLTSTPGVVKFPRILRPGAAVAMFGAPVKRGR